MNSITKIQNLEDLVDRSLKFQDLIDSEDLPFPCPDKCSNVNMDAYRFVSSTQIDASQFLPTNLVDKQNGRARRYSAYNGCIQYAISLYDSEDKAKSALSFLTKKLKDKWPSRLIARGCLVENDGLASQASSDGHFSFFEYKKSDLSAKFFII